MSSERLKHLIYERSLKIADEPVFKLASGKLSRFYLDLKQITFDPEGIYLLGQQMYKFLKPFNPEAVGGLTLGADPIAYAVCFSSYGEGNPIKPFVVRKEPKGHGMGRQIEGLVGEGSRVAILEDVVTTGGSALKALKACREAGFEIIGVFAVVDREEGGKENINAEGVELYSLFKLSDFIS
jgi:orotate phosphoribosyltransferase